MPGAAILHTVFALAVQDPAPEPAGVAETAAPGTGESELDDVDQVELAARANAAFEAGDYERALALTRTLHGRSGLLHDLFAIAVIERARGHCREATLVAAQVMAAEPSSELAEHARALTRACESELTERAAPAPAPAAKPQISNDFPP